MPLTMAMATTETRRRATIPVTSFISSVIALEPKFADEVEVVANAWHC